MQRRHCFGSAPSCVVMGFVAAALAGCPLPAQPCNSDADCTAGYRCDPSAPLGDGTGTCVGFWRAPPAPDASLVAPDGGRDAGRQMDASLPDAALSDAAIPDAGGRDGASGDASISDAAISDAAITDAALSDGAISDAAGSLDGSLADAADPADASEPDAAAPPDSGSIDAGVVCHGTPPVCAPAVDVLRVCSSAVDGCDPASDYDSVGSAVSDASPSGTTYIFVYAGRFRSALTVTSGTLVIVGEPGTTLSPWSDIPLNVQGDAIVKLHGVTITGDADGDGDVENGSALIDLEDNSRLYAEDIALGPAGYVALYARAGTYAGVRRCYVRRAHGGGLRIEGRGHIENCIIVENGDSGGNGSYRGGVDLRGPAGGVVMRHNTIANNWRRGGGPGGVVCTNANNVENSIIWNNEQGDIASPCRPLNCDVGGSPNADAGNFSANPRFADGGSYRLSSSSPCIDRAVDGPSTADAGPVTDDVDREVRPRGDAGDVGADEAQ